VFIREIQALRLFATISSCATLGWNASCRKIREIKNHFSEVTMFKRIAVMALLLAFLSLAIPSDTFAGNRWRRSGNRAVYGRTYYTSPYRYQNRYQRATYYASPYRYQRATYYNPYRYGGVAGNRFYGSRRSSTRDTILRIAAPAAVGAGLGALLGGKKGAAVGALFGGGGGAIYHLIRNRNRRY
jgi:hypothetical protein